ncbi:MAG TPA: hypothetical protein VNI01_15465 [Elusimicrobiota bacterium]|jgi:hypothetical protein|nr:hypothetical protein [Elusimicrobiota bacterium]
MAKIEKRIQYTVPLVNQPGQIDRLATALAGKRVSLLGLAAGTMADIGYVRFIATEDLNLRGALKDAGFEAIPSPVFCVPLLHKAGELARLTKVLRAADVNITALYGTAIEGEHAMLVLSVDKPTQAEEPLMEFARGMVLASH